MGGPEAGSRKLPGTLIVDAYESNNLEYLLVSLGEPSPTNERDVRQKQGKSLEPGLTLRDLASSYRITAARILRDRSTRHRRTDPEPISISAQAASADTLARSPSGLTSVTQRLNRST